MVKNIYWLLKQVVDEFLKKSKNQVKSIKKNLNYKKLINSNLLLDIQKEVYHLQKLNIFSISDSERKSLFINLFNIMNIQSLIENGRPVFFILILPRSIKSQEFISSHKQIIF
jgi:hypothetical protein